MRKSQRKRKYQKRKTKKYLGGNAYPSTGLHYKYNTFNQPSMPKLQKGGVNLTPSNTTISFVGNSWTPAISGWPGVNGSSNYLEPNTYPTDVQLAMKSNIYI
jgi:hypothetical protein